jgi:hypothetical protein
MLEYWWSTLTGAEQKVLDFCLRMLLGHHKVCDRISVSQFVSGVGKNNRGSGVSKAQVIRALNSLEEKGFIVLHKQKFRTNEICLVLEDEPVEIEVKEVSETALRLVEVFRAIVPHQVDGFKRSKRHIEAIENLLGHYSPEQIEEIIHVAFKANGRKYAPTITSPVELEKNLGKLVAFIQKQNDRSGGFSISI